MQYKWNALVFSRNDALNSKKKIGKQKVVWYLNNIAQSTHMQTDTNKNKTIKKIRVFLIITIFIIYIYYYYYIFKRYSHTIQVIGLNIITSRDKVEVVVIKMKNNKK